jgi:molybdopterin converting factor small subunit
MIIAQTESSLKIAEHPLELSGLAPTPAEEWTRLIRFVGLGHADQEAMAQTVEPLFAHGLEVVTANYDYLQRVPETAAILGWEQGADPEHLAERRQFFTIWMARTLGLDLGTDFADYLFYAGKAHAGHGPRHIHVPDTWITGAISLTQTTFARLIAEQIQDRALAAAAMAGWNKYLMIQLDLMLLGYRIARAWDDGTQSVRVTFFGRLRDLTRTDALTAHTHSDATVAEVLRKVLNYFPALRSEVMETHWQEADQPNSLWTHVEPVYTPRLGWRLLQNGKDLRYYGGFAAPIHAEDELALFPPGR